MTCPNITVFFAIIFPFESIIPAFKVVPPKSKPNKNNCAIPRLSHSQSSCVVRDFLLLHLRTVIVCLTIPTRNTKKKKNALILHREIVLRQNYATLDGTPGGRPISIRDATMQFNIKATTLRDRLKDPMIAVGS